MTQKTETIEELVAREKLFDETCRSNAERLTDNELRYELKYVRVLHPTWRRHVELVAKARGI